MAASFARFYQRNFDKRPAITLAVTNGTLSLFADFVAQSTQIFLSPVDAEIHGYDLPRLARFLVFGAAMGPVVGRWNLFLERHFPLRPQRKPSLMLAAGSSRSEVSLKALGKRVLIDQGVMAPIGLALFIGSMGFMEGRTVSQVQQRYSDLFRPAILANWMVWPIIQLINFRFMPLAYRVPFQASCGIFWTLYLSLINSSEDTKQSVPVVEI